MSELEAMRKIVNILLKLDTAARGRVLASVSGLSGEQQPKDGSNG